MAVAISRFVFIPSPTKVGHTRLKSSSFIPSLTTTSPAVFSPSQSHSVFPFRVSLPSTRHLTFTNHGLEIESLLNSISTSSQYVRCSLVVAPSEVDNSRETDDREWCYEDAKAIETFPLSTFENATKKNRLPARYQQTSAKGKNPKCLNIDATPTYKIDPYQILKYPLRTESTMRSLQLNATLVFIVDRRADKKTIRGAVQMMLGIQTRKVNTLILPDGKKKAYVMLKPGYDALEVAKKINFI